MNPFRYTKHNVVIHPLHEAIYLLGVGLEIAGELALAIGSEIVQAAFRLHDETLPQDEEHAARAGKESE